MLHNRIASGWNESGFWNALIRTSVISRSLLNIVPFRLSILTAGFPRFGTSCGPTLMPKHRFIKRSFCYISLCCVIACLVLILPERRTLEASVGPDIRENVTVSAQEPAYVSEPMSCCKTFVRYQPSLLEFSISLTELDGRKVVI